VPCNYVTAAATLSDRELLRRIEVLAGQERDATVELIAHLAELDTRKLFRGEGYGSLFAYCTQALHLSEHAAYNRIEAARASRTFPVVLAHLSEGALNLSTLRLLAPHLTTENHRGLLGRASGRSKREVEALVARLAPQSDVLPSIRKLPTTPAQTAEMASLAAETSDRGTAADASRFDLDSAHDSDQSSPPVPNQAPRVPHSSSLRPVVAPLSPERYRIQFTMGRETHQKLHRAQDLLRREIPDGDPGAIFDRALELLLQDVARRKWAATVKPGPRRGSERRSRYVPAAVKRAVWLRDGGQCAFVAARTGRRCAERTFLEFHHLEPYAAGGETTVANLSLRCRVHNAYECDLVFGRSDPTLRDARAHH
jgi:hypothetical protein